MNLGFQRAKKIVFLALVGVCFPWPGAPASVSPRLRYLAKRAGTWRGRIALRRYAQLTRDRETRGLAYFALGYKEYEARLYEPAAQDLLRATTTRCSLAGFAEYYEAVTDHLLNRDSNAVTVLEDFLARYPDNVFQQPATDLLADLLLRAGRPDRALQLLNSEPDALDRPPALILLARANSVLQNLEDAARMDQRIYYQFPTSFEARDAEFALRDLRARLGARFPVVSDEARTARAEDFFRYGLSRKALGEYDSLLINEPKSSFRSKWRLARARCLLRLGLYSQATESLDRPFYRNPTANAKRLALLVYAQARAKNEAAMIEALDELYKLAPHSASYAQALAYAGGYFARHGFWQDADQYYRRLAQGFAGNPAANEGCWRVAWYDILAGNASQAENDLAAYLKNYSAGSRVPAALYWLAWLRNRDGAGTDAETICRYLSSRYANSYYAFKARHLSVQARRRLEDRDAPHDPAIASLLASLPPRSPSLLQPCTSAEPDPLSEPFVTLTALDLAPVADEYLDHVIQEGKPDATFFLAVAHARSAARDTSSALFSARSAVPDYQDYSFAHLPKEVWELLYPRAYWSLVRGYARANGLSPYLVMGVIRQESAFDPRATSYTDARGLMQMEPRTANIGVRGYWRRRWVARELYNPAFNLRLSCHYLGSLLREFGGNTAEALAAYNAGDNRVQEWLANGKLPNPSTFFLESIPFTDTRAYVEAVLRDAAVYRDLFNGRAQFAACREQHP